jgi:hypothetical protein
MERERDPSCYRRSNLTTICLGAGLAPGRPFHPSRPRQPESQHSAQMDFSAWPMFYVKQTLSPAAGSRLLPDCCFPMKRRISELAGADILLGSLCGINTFSSNVAQMLSPLNCAPPLKEDHCAEIHEGHGYNYPSISRAIIEPRFSAKRQTD